MKNALSFDIEENFQAEVFAQLLPMEEWPSLGSRVAASTQGLLDLLDPTGIRATFFVLGWVAERHPLLVREIDRRGHEVACHGYGHRMIHRMTRRGFVEDVARAKGVLEEILGVPVIGYRAPTFSVVRETLWSLEVLREAGFRYDSSIYPIRHDRYGIPDAPRFPHRRAAGDGGEIVEFPPSTVALLGLRLPVAGGGYFRLFPYRATRWALRRLNGVEGQPAMVYLHPWEVVPAPPPVSVGWLTEFRHSVNAGKTAPRLRRLLAEFDFAPVRDVLALHGVLAPGGTP